MTKKGTPTKLADKVEEWFEQENLKQKLTPVKLGNKIIQKAWMLNDNHTPAIQEKGIDQEKIEEQISELMIYCIQLSNYYHLDYETLISENLDKKMRRKKDEWKNKLGTTNPRMQ